MFSITFRRRNRQGEELDQLSILTNDEFSGGKPSGTAEDELPALFEASFCSSSSASSFDEDDMSTATSSSRRVSFLLKQEDVAEPIRKGSNNKKTRSPSLLRRNSKKKIMTQHNETIKSSKPLLSGEIPLAKVVLVEDGAEATTTISPGSRLWMVGTLPVDEQETYSPAIPPIHEDSPFDEMDQPEEEQDVLGSSEEQSSCHGQVKVEDQGDGRWKVGNDQQQVCITLPNETDLGAELPRDLVIEQCTDLAVDDVYFCIDDKNVPEWTVESLLLALFQLVVLKVSSSI